MDFCSEAMESAMEADTAAWMEELESANSGFVAGKVVGEEETRLGEEAWALNSLTTASAAGLGRLLALEAAAFEAMLSAQENVPLQLEPLMWRLLLLHLAP